MKVKIISNPQAKQSIPKALFGIGGIGGGSNGDMQQKVMQVLPYLLENGGAIPRADFGYFVEPQPIPQNDLSTNPNQFRFDKQPLPQPPQWNVEMMKQVSGLPYQGDQLKEIPQQQEQKPEQKQYSTPKQKDDLQKSQYQSFKDMGAPEWLADTVEIAHQVSHVVDDAYTGFRDGLMALPNLIPAAKANHNPLRQLVDNQQAYGTGSQAIYKDGGQLSNNMGIQSLWGGNVEQMSYNPYDGGTAIAEGASHRDGGIGIMTNGQKVEVQGNEPIVKDDKGNTIVLGGIKPIGSNKTFQTMGKEIGKDEAEANKVLEKAKDLSTTNLANKFSALKITTSNVLKDKANQELKIAAIKKQNLIDHQQTILDHAEALGIKPEKAAEKIAKSGMKISMDGGDWIDSKQSKDLWNSEKSLQFKINTPDKKKVEILEMPSHKTPQLFNTDFIHSDKVYDIMGNETFVPNLPDSWNRQQIDEWFSANPENGITNYNQYREYMKYGGEIPKAKGGWKSKKFNDENETASNENYNIESTTSIPNQITYYSQAYGIDPDITLPQFNIESSGYKPAVVGPYTKFGKAKSHMQFLPATAKEYGISEEQLTSTKPEDINAVSKAGIQYMRDLKKQLNNDDLLAAAAYNGGINNIQANLKYISKKTGTPINQLSGEDWYNFMNTRPGLPKGQRETVKYVGDILQTLPQKNNEDYSNLASSDNQFRFDQHPVQESFTQTTQPEWNKEMFRTISGLPTYDKTHDVIPQSQQPQKKLPSLADKNKLGIGDFLSDITALFDRPDYVPRQEYQPRMYTPYQVSMQDALDENNASFRSVAQQLSGNPEALATLAGQKYQSDQKILADQFRTNQGIMADVINKNIELTNNAQLQNNQYGDIQADRQARAKAVSEQNKHNALNDIETKIASNRRDNNNIRLYENLFNYRPDDKLNMKYEGPNASFNYNSAMEKLNSITNTKERSSYLDNKKTEQEIEKLRLQTEKEERAQKLALSNMFGFGK